MTLEVIANRRTKQFETFDDIAKFTLTVKTY